ncbi:MAG: hypothetical protein WCA56_24030 [Xanthobacteraceae bacterium]
MTTIARLVSNWQRRSIGEELTTLNDKVLVDIGFRVIRRDLDAVKPFWMA